MTADKMKETLKGQFELWHGIVASIAVVITFILTRSFAAGSEYRTIKSELSALQNKTGLIESKMEKLDAAVLTNNPTDKQSWMAFRENTISVQATLIANQATIISQLEEINNKLDIRRK